jgi:phenylpropionate dioxygenase-like ring-hydroxylating dioxygenase large terminal subunit
MNWKTLFTLLVSFRYVQSFGTILPNFFRKALTMSREPVEIPKIIDYPKLNYHELTEQHKFDLQWYTIGIDTEFIVNKPQKITVWNKNYVVWKNSNGSYVALDDVCSHKSASLSKGKVCNSNIVCPYHGYEFNENGTLAKVPGICFRPSPIYDVSKYQVLEKNGWVYLNTCPDSIDLTTNTTYQYNIFEEEEVARNDSVVFLKMPFNCYSRILSENSLDVMHIGFVHTFGNAKNPAPIEIHAPRLIGPHHYKTSYSYEAGERSIARKYYGIKNITIENEFILPHTTVARVIFGEYVSTVITFALPVNDDKSILFVKTYRNFMQNAIGDKISKDLMFNTMLQDKVIVENIDKRFIDGKFNMRFDKLQNTYTSFYKRFIHEFDNN